MVSERGVEWEEDEELESPPRTPDIAMDDDEVENTVFEYSDRHPTDWVVSGLLGVRFQSWAAAERWARKKYGDRLIRSVPEAMKGGRWAFLIKGVR